MKNTVMNNEKTVCVDANTAVGNIAYALSELALIFPITPSSAIAEYMDEQATAGKLNIFGSKVKVAEMQSEKGAAGAVHGSLATGSMTSTFTASQGLLLMIPNMYKIAGELFPCVFHVTARTIATHALSIFGDHSDVMACRQVGFAMLASNNPQEAQDLALISHIATYKTSIPFMHFYDGFRTSHEIGKIKTIDYSIIQKMLPEKEISEFKARALSNVNPRQSGTAQNPDIFFQNREACNKFYFEAYDKIVAVMDQFYKLTGRKYAPFVYCGDSKATDVVVLIGSGCDTVEATVDVLNKNNQHTGVLKVHLYRPFNAAAFVKALPKTVKNITVLDRTKEPGSVGEPLYIDVVSALKEQGKEKVKVYSGRYGLGGKDFTPENVVSVFENMHAKNPINHFSVGIVDDVTFKSLPNPKKKYDFASKAYECLFYGLGSDGTISANKSTIKIIGLNTNKNIQGFFEYDSKKSGSLTISHLRISDYEIKAPYAVKSADFVAIHNYVFVHNYDILKDIKPNGKVLINTSLSLEQLARDLPENFKKQIKAKKLELYTIPANKVATAAGLGNRINTIMQACFFKITNIIDFDKAINEMKTFATKAYAKKGEAIIKANINGIDMATQELAKVDTKVIVNTKSDSFVPKYVDNDFYNKIIKPINERKGNDLPVSSFNPYGVFPTATTQYEKRGISDSIPVCDIDKCIQCGMCSFVCPHSVIKGYAIDKKSIVKVPKSIKTKSAIGLKDADFTIQTSPLDCTGCKVCVKSCPVKALSMQNLKPIQDEQIKNYEFLESMPKYDIQKIFNTFKVPSVKTMQFVKPLFEFSGACSGCGETPYVKLITQLFGSNMIVANATGCSSIYGGSAPTCPYSVNDEGFGPSWSNSLFEDNAEYGFGMFVSYQYQREFLYQKLQELSKTAENEKVKAEIKNLLKYWDESTSNFIGKSLVEQVKKLPKSSPLAKTIIANQNYLGKKSFWIIGGDGWSYDIDSDGVDHILASGANVNILILDNELYSNTGGQASKSTPMGCAAKFAASGKQTRKKDLGAMAMTYKDVYVAQVCMGANPQQLINALIEAESYNGVSLVIAFAPCINHGVDVSNSQAIEKEAVLSGYWNLYRYDPRKEKPMSIDSPAPTLSYQDFIKKQNRYANLMRSNPERAAKLFADSEKNAADRREELTKH